MKKVRLKNAPHRIGEIDPEAEPRVVGNKERIRIQFDDGTSDWFFKEQIEYVETATDDPYLLLGQGKFGPLRHLRRAIVSARLRGNLSNFIYSMEVSKTDFYPYQFKPVLRLLESPNKGILIADEVGLGKTIEAGLIWTELRARFYASRLVVLCPAFLRDKWAEELANRFGVATVEVSASQLLDQLRLSRQHRSQRSFALIASFETARSNEELIEFLQEETEADKLIDLLIVDEVHKARNRETDSYKITKALRDVADYTAFLSATPIMLHSGDMFEMLHLLDSATYRWQAMYEEILNLNRPLIRLRERVLSQEQLTVSEIETVLDTYEHERVRLLGIDSKQIENLRKYLAQKLSSTVGLSMENRAQIGERLDYCNLNSMVVNRTRRREVELEFQRERKPVDQDVYLTTDERDLFNLVTAEVRSYSLVKNIPEGFLLSTPQRQLASSIPATLLRWSQNTVASEEVDMDNSALQLVSETLDDSCNDVRIRRIAGEMESHLLAQDRIREYLKRKNEFILSDSKYSKLISELKPFLLAHPQDQIVLFSYFRDTLDYLHVRLKNDGIETIVLHGGVRVNKDAQHKLGQKRNAKTTILEKFQSNKDIRVLLTSEMGSEGIDLQFCRVLINYDLPWNPMRIEQRVGRLDRIGQKSKLIWIWNFIARDTIDDRIYRRLLLRLRVFTDALGGLEEFIGSQIRQMTAKLLSEDLSPEEQALLIDRTEQAIENKKAQEETLENEAVQLVAAGSSILQKIEAAHHMHRRVSNSDLLLYCYEILRECFPDSHCERKRDEPIIANIRLGPKAHVAYQEFLKLHGQHESTLLLQYGDTHCLFENKLVSEAPANVECINQHHPFIRFLAQENGKRNTGYKVIGASINKNALADACNIPTGYYVLIVRSLVISSQVTIQNLHYGGKSLDGDRSLTNDQAELLVRDLLEHGQEWEGVMSAIDCKKAELRAFELLEVAQNMESEFAEVQTARMDDRFASQEATAKERFERSMRILEIRRQNDERTESKLLRATIGKIEKLRSNYEIELERIRSSRDNRKIEAELVCLCVTDVVE